MEIRQYIEEEKRKFKEMSAPANLPRINSQPILPPESKPVSIRSEPIQQPKINPAVVNSNPFPQNKFQQPSIGVFSTMKVRK